jgi:hypothetical protein
MHGCPPELDAKRDRINCRELVMRNLLALSAGSTPYGVLESGAGDSRL